MESEMTETERKELNQQIEWYNSLKRLEDNEDYKTVIGSFISQIDDFLEGASTLYGDNRARTMEKVLARVELKKFLKVIKDNASKAKDILDIEG